MFFQDEHLFLGDTLISYTNVPRGPTSPLCRWSTDQVGKVISLLEGMASSIVEEGKVYRFFGMALGPNCLWQVYVLLAFRAWLWIIFCFVFMMSMVELRADISTKNSQKNTKNQDESWKRFAALASCKNGARCSDAARLKRKRLTSTRICAKRGSQPWSTRRPMARSWSSGVA